MTRQSRQGPGERTVVGVIGGSGLYEIDGLEEISCQQVKTPFGDPSADLVTGRLEGVEMVFLPRHGRGHRISPSELNYRANIFALKKLGVSRIISISAVGSMREDIRPGDMVVCDQFLDRTQTRVNTFFEGGIVAHVLFADPVCPVLSGCLHEAGVGVGARVHRGGTYLVIEGPQFSTRAESRLYRQWQVDVIGMTNLPEARLAREAEICYATLALATDYDCWHETEADVSVEAVLRVIRENVRTAQQMIRSAVRQIPSRRDCACARALQDAIVTDPNEVPAKLKKDLGLLVGKYLS